MVYHSARHGTNEQDYIKNNEFDPTTGDFLWHNVLMDIKKRNPKINNVYCEIGSSFGLLAVDNPLMPAPDRQERQCATVPTTSSGALTACGGARRSGRLI